MGYWLKSFNDEPPPVPGTSFSVPQINSRKSTGNRTTYSTNILVPIPTTAIFIIMALSWAWLSDGPLQGARWPFIYAGAVLTVSACLFPWWHSVLTAQNLAHI